MTDAEAMISDCFKLYHLLNDWERGFIDGLGEMDGNLTERQLETLEKIWEKIT